MKSFHVLLITFSFTSLLFLQNTASANQLEEFHRLAEQGDIKAQSHLGYIYYVGEGVQQNYQEAVKWYLKAAAQGDRDAQYNLAVAYAFGEGVKQNFSQAATWYRRAGEQGHKIAQYSLGLSYAYGEGVPQDSKEAAKWFEKSALQGYSRAQVHLASMYHIGDGVARNFSEAAEWYRKAADRGDPTAQYNLGSLYRSGKGVEQSLSQAKRWFRLAADQGYAPAQNELASLSFKPVTKDIAQAEAEPEPEAANQTATADTIETKQAEDKIADVSIAKQESTEETLEEAIVDQTTKQPEEDISNKTVVLVPADTTSEIHKPIASASNLISLNQATTIPSPAPEEVTEVVEETSDEEKGGGLFDFIGGIFKTDENNAAESIAESSENDTETQYISHEAEETKINEPATETTLAVNTPAIEEQPAVNNLKEEPIQATLQPSPVVDESIVPETTSTVEETAIAKTDTEEKPSFFDNLFGSNETTAASGEESVQETAETETPILEETSTTTEDKTLVVDHVDEEPTAEPEVAKEKQEPSFFDKLFAPAETSVSSEEESIEAVAEPEVEEAIVETEEPAPTIEETMHTDNEAIALTDESTTEPSVDVEEKEELSFFDKLFGKKETVASTDEEEVNEIKVAVVETEEVTEEVVDSVEPAEEIETVENETIVEEAIEEVAVQETEISEQTPSSGGIAGFFNNLFGESPKDEIAEIDESEDSFETVYHEQHEIVTPEVNEPIDSPESTEITSISAETTPSTNITLVKSYEPGLKPAKNLQPPPVTDSVVKNENKLKSVRESYDRKDYESTLIDLEPIAAEGNAEAQSLLGSMYYAGNGVNKDLEQAFVWHLRAAEQGNAHSQYSVGNMYLMGEGVSQDNQLAHQWYAQAAAQGHSSAQNNLTNLERIAQNEQVTVANAQTETPMPDSEPVTANTIESSVSDEPKSDNGLPTFIDDLFKPSQSTAEALPEKTYTGSTATPGTPVKAEENTVATVYPLKEEQSPENIDVVNLQEQSDEENSTQNSGGLFDQLFDSNDEAMEVAEINPESKQANEEELGEFFDEMFNETPAIQTASQDTEQLQPTPLPEPVEVETVEDIAITETETVSVENAVLKETQTKAIQGDAQAQYELANAFYTGQGVEQDHSQSFLWYRRAAQQGNIDAQYALGNVYLMGEGVSQNDQEALRWYELAAKQGHEAAQSNYDNLAKLASDRAEPVSENTTEETIVPPDETAIAINSSEQLENNDTESTNEKTGFFGSIKNALGFNQDKETVENTGINSDELDEVETVYIDDSLQSETQTIVAEQESNATEEQTITPAEESLALTPEAEITESSSSPKASAEEDYQLGLAYVHGDGVAANRNMAFDYFKKAAEAGHINAQYHLANAYAYGEGVEKNQLLAADWYRKAAEQGEPLSQRQLAKLYWSGKGVEQDKATAHAWYSIIANNGNSMDKQRLNNIQEEMTNEELDESRRIASELSAQLPRL